MLSRVISLLFTTARLLCDVRAVKNHCIVHRIKNHVVGRQLARAFRKLL